MKSWADVWRHWRRQVKVGAPFVRRREYRILEQKYSRLIEALDNTATPASHANLQTRKPVPTNLKGEVCLFVTYSPIGQLKAHATCHIQHLLDVGLNVVLIFNTDLSASELIIDAGLEARVSGVLVRDNLGFDFGAWAHAYSLLDSKEWQRLYLVNDSVVGPLEQSGFLDMMKRIRSCKSDFLGLTESLAPIRHLQSYFLVFNHTALCSPTFAKLMGGVLNFPHKGQVVDVYEVRFTQLLSAAGLRFEAIFPALSDDIHNADDTSARWEKLISAGFPYLKTRIIQQLPNHPQVQAARLVGQVDGQI